MFTTHEFSAPHSVADGATHVLRGMGGIGGGFNSIHLSHPRDNWSLATVYTGGTGNHGKVSLLPVSEEAKQVASAVSLAYWRGVLDLVSAVGWTQAPELLRKIPHYVGAVDSPFFSLGYSRWEKSCKCYDIYEDDTYPLSVIDSGKNSLTVGLFRVLTDYPVNASIYDVPHYYIAYFGGANSATLAELKSNLNLDCFHEEDRHLEVDY